MVAQTFECFFLVGEEDDGAGRKRMMQEFRMDGQHVGGKRPKKGG